MADRQVYLDNTDDQISAQKRREEGRDGSGILTVAKMVGSIAAVMIARRKLNFSRAFSSEIKATGIAMGQGGERFGRYELTSLLRDKSANKISRMKNLVRNIGEGLIRPLPTANEQIAITKALFKKNGMDINVLNQDILNVTSKWSRWDTFRRGPIKAIAPNAPIVLPGRTLTSGSHGGMYVGGKLFKFGSTGQVSEVIAGLDIGLSGTMGERLASKMAFGHIEEPIGSIKDFTRRVIAPDERSVILEHKRQAAEKHLGSQGRSLPVGPEKETTSDVIRRLSDAIDDIARTGELDQAEAVNSWQFFKREKENIERSAKEALEGIIDVESRKASTKFSYWMNKAGRKIGISEEYAQGGTGIIQGLWKSVKGNLGMGIPIEPVGRKIPFSVRARNFRGNVGDINKEIRNILKSNATLRSNAIKNGIQPGSLKFGNAWEYGAREYTNLARDTFKGPPNIRTYRVSHRRYFNEKQSVTGAWESGITGGAYLYPAGEGLKRGVADTVAGTFFKQFSDRLTGFGLTTRPDRFTDFISHVTGATRGSVGEYFIRSYIGGFARLGVVGAGAVLTFQTIDYLARRTTGWGVTDVAGKVYTSAREFQQNVIDNLGIVDAAREAEKLFPGIINSPAARLARITAPLYMSAIGKRAAGVRGSRLGLALGIATALITWGDITQSPEELHRIYTGEQDIPIRKGRYWIFGSTPFGGGKVAYWRPHWYPMMRSKYKNQGQLWDSEKERIAQGSWISPIAAPILTGKKWDPYYWEKKHYYDRPYPVTGELFEPTMPFAWLGNMTIGRLIKPQREMHPEYRGVAQEDPGASKTIVPGAAAQLGMETPVTDPMLPVNQPGSVGWKASEAAYTMAEQAGLRGWLVNVMAEKVTGRPDFLPEGTVAQSASRATGLERAYWDMNIGDPGGVTEFYRRVLPHRRRAVEEYNPIRNTMPDWMPGGDYFINFKTGDPYVKTEMGEARLPGAGYESLHRLHSGIPKVYDAVDRFLILSDIAPYSNEYKHYRYLAEAMTKKDPYWSGVVAQHIEQRAKTQQEFDFLSLTPPEDVTGPARSASTVYRHFAAGVSSVGAALDPVLGMPLGMPIVTSPTSKLFPHKTAIQTYKSYRLQGSEFTNWANPIRDFLGPDLERLKDLGSNLGDGTTISSRERERREYEEYFDRLQYIKFKKLERMANDVGNAQLSRKFRTMSARTMTGVNPYVAPGGVMGALPRRERGFFTAFSEAPKSDRAEIERIVSPQMARIYRAQWAMRDGEDRARNVDKYSPVEENEAFFSKHKVPDEDWSGWNPEIDIKDVQLKTVRNEGMNIHNFDLWESQARLMERRPFVPEINNIRDAEGSMENLRRIMYGQLQNDGYSDSRIYVTRTPAIEDSVNIRIKVIKDRSVDADLTMREVINA